ncbi:MAG: methylmalonyl-CoA mutase, partial [Planctomycetes bacterium]|nr:methylmalonyl-CoA mutase [Planctomycetota bacterium]
EATAPLPRARLAEPFEALRAASDASLVADGQRPGAFLMGLGELAAHAGRSMWIRNLLAAGGVEALGAEADEPHDVLDAFRTSGARVAVLCGRDADYLERIPVLCAGLREAGAAAVLVAGRPGEREAAWREAGVTDFLYLGCDVVEALRTLVSTLEASA